MGLRRRRLQLPMSPSPVAVHLDGGVSKMSDAHMHYARLGQSSEFAGIA
jgi:hypothetical protein